MSVFPFRKIFDGTVCKFQNIPAAAVSGLGSSATLAASTTPAATTVCEWDANINLSANNHVDGATVIATAGATTTLTVASARIQILTGVLTQIVKLPTALVPVGYQQTIFNLSTVAVTVQSSGANTITVLLPGGNLTFTANTVTPTTALNWSAGGVPVGQWQPANHGLIGWAFDPVMIYESSVPSSNGLLYATGIIVPQATTITNVVLNVFTAGSGLTSGENFAGLYQNGTLLAATADQSTNWATAATYTAPLSTPQAVQAGLVYVAYFANGTTRPAFGAAGGTTGSVNLGLSNPRWGTFSGGGYTTALPSTLPALTAGSPARWAAVS